MVVLKANKLKSSVNCKVDIPQALADEIATEGKVSWNYSMLRELHRELLKQSFTVDYKYITLADARTKLKGKYYIDIEETGVPYTVGWVYDSGTTIFELLLELYVLKPQALRVDKEKATIYTDKATITGVTAVVLRFAELLLRWDCFDSMLAGMGLPDTDNVRRTPPTHSNIESYMSVCSRIESTTYAKDITDFVEYGVWRLTNDDTVQDICRQMKPVLLDEFGVYNNVIAHIAVALLKYTSMVNTADADKLCIESFLHEYIRRDFHKVLLIESLIVLTGKGTIFNSSKNYSNSYEIFTGYIQQLRYMDDYEYCYGIREGTYRNKSIVELLGKVSESKGSRYAGLIEDVVFEDNTTIEQMKEYDGSVTEYVCYRVKRVGYENCKDYGICMFRNNIYTKSSGLKGMEFLTFYDGNVYMQSPFASLYEIKTHGFDWFKNNCSTRRTFTKNMISNTDKAPDKFITNIDSWI